MTFIFIKIKEKKKHVGKAQCLIDFKQIKNNTHTHTYKEMFCFSRIDEKIFGKPIKTKRKRREIILEMR